jgi:hypothetical protein
VVAVVAQAPARVIERQQKKRFRQCQQHSLSLGGPLGDARTRLASSLCIVCNAANARTPSLRLLIFIPYA